MHKPDENTVINEKFLRIDLKTVIMIASILFAIVSGAWGFGRASMNMRLEDFMKSSLTTEKQYEIFITRNEIVSSLKEIQTQLNDIRGQLNATNHPSNPK